MDWPPSIPSSRSRPSAADLIPSETAPPGLDWGEGKKQPPPSTVHSTPPNDWNSQGARSSTVRTGCSRRTSSFPARTCWLLGWILQARPQSRCNGHQETAKLPASTHPYEQGTCLGHRTTGVPQLNTSTGVHITRLEMRWHGGGRCAFATPRFPYGTFSASCFRSSSVAMASTTHVHTCVGRFGLVRPRACTPRTRS